MIFVVRAICLLIYFSVCSCVGSQNRQERVNSELPVEISIQMNKRLVEEEQKIIEKYVKDNNLEMNRTETGLWYKISEEGDGEKIETGKIVSLNYSVRLINETLLYTSEELGHKEFLVGQGGVETGLEEAVLMLKNGCKAKLIIPSHLAHGILGDDNKIPSRAILLYDVEVVEVKRK